MTLLHYNPITPSLRNKITLNLRFLSKKKPEKLLITKLLKKSGRNNQGKITSRHKGAGHKQKYRIIDFKRNKYNSQGLVKAFEYDPNRNVYLALIYYLDGEKRYILAPQDLKIGDVIITAYNAPILPGNTSLLQNIPLGTFIHNLEYIPGKGGQLIRAAGTYGKLIAKEYPFVIIKLPSKEMRLFNEKCYATIGRLANSEYFLIKKGKAGVNRWLGKRPKVRGAAMNPIDHPHGGGEGKASIGKPQPRTPWGKIALGVKTRLKQKHSNQFILKFKK